MKRNPLIVLLVAVVAVASWIGGRASAGGFEFLVTVDETGAQLQALEGCRWTQARYGGPRESYSFVVSANGVSTGP
jgi:hypothetical protein